MPKDLPNVDSQEYSKKTNLSPKTLKEICGALVISFGHELITAILRNKATVKTIIPQMSKL